MARPYEKVMTSLIRNRLRNMPDLRKGYLYITASDFGVDIVKLKYRLSREGSSYQKLLLEERKRRLLELLKSEPHAHILEVAPTLGYISDKSVRTAIKTWGKEIGATGHTKRGRVL